MADKKYGVEEITEEKDNDLEEEIPKFPEQGDKPKNVSKTKKIKPVKTLKSSNPIKKAMWSNPEDQKKIQEGLKAANERKQQLLDTDTTVAGKTSATDTTQRKIDESNARLYSMENHGMSGRQSDDIPKAQVDSEGKEIKDAFTDARQQRKTELENMPKEEKKASEDAKKNEENGLRFRAQKIAKEKGISEDLAMVWVNEERKKDKIKFDAETSKMLSKEGYSSGTDWSDKLKAADDKKKADDEANAKLEAEYQKRINSEKAKQILKGAGLLGINLAANLPEIGALHLKNTHRLFMAFFNKKPMSAVAQSLAAIAGGVADAESVLKKIDKVYGIDPKNEYSKGIGVGTLKYAMHSKDRVDAENAMKDVATDLDTMFDGIDPEHMTYDDYLEIEEKFKKYIMSEMKPLLLAEQEAKARNVAMPYSQVMRLEALRSVSKYIDQEGASLKKAYGYDKPGLVQARESKIMEEIGLNNLSDDPLEALKQIDDAYRQLESKYGESFADLKNRKMSGERLKQDEDVAYAAIENLHKLRENISKDRKNYKKWYDEEMGNINVANAKNAMHDFERTSGLDTLNTGMLASDAYALCVQAQGMFDDEFGSKLELMDKDIAKLSPAEKKELEAMKKEKSYIDDLVKKYKKGMQDEFVNIKKDISDRLLVDGKQIFDLKTNEELDEFTTNYFKKEYRNGHTMDEYRRYLLSESMKRKLTPVETETHRALKSYHDLYTKQFGEIPRILKKEKIEQMNKDFEGDWGSYEVKKNLYGMEMPVIFEPKRLLDATNRPGYYRWLYERFGLEAYSDKPREMGPVVYARTLDGDYTMVLVPADPLECRAMVRSLTTYHKDLMDKARILNKDHPESEEGKIYTEAAKEVERTLAIISENTQMTGAKNSVTYDIDRTPVENWRYNFGKIEPIAMLKGYPIGTAGINISRAMASRDTFERNKKDGKLDKYGQEIPYDQKMNACDIIAFNSSNVWMYKRMIDRLKKMNGKVDPITINNTEKEILASLNKVLLINKNPGDAFGERYDVTGEVDFETLLRQEGYGEDYLNFIDLYSKVMGLNPDSEWDDAENSLINLIKERTNLSRGTLDRADAIAIALGVLERTDKDKESKEEGKYKKMAEDTELTIDDEMAVVNTDIGAGFRKTKDDNSEDYLRCCVGVSRIQRALGSDIMRSFLMEHASDIELIEDFEKAFTPSGSTNNNGRNKLIKKMKSLVRDDDPDRDTKLNAIDVLDNEMSFWADQMSLYLNTGGTNPWSMSKKEKDKALIKKVSNAMLFATRLERPGKDDLKDKALAEMPEFDKFGEHVSSDIFSYDVLMNMSSLQRREYVRNCMTAGKYTFGSDDDSVSKALKDYEFSSKSKFMFQLKNLNGSYSEAKKVIEKGLALAGIDDVEIPEFDEIVKTMNAKGWTPMAIIDQSLTLEDFSGQIMDLVKDDKFRKSLSDKELGKIADLLDKLVGAGSDSSGRRYDDMGLGETGKLYTKSDRGVGIVRLGKQSYNMWLLDETVFGGRRSTQRRMEEMDLAKDDISKIVKEVSADGPLSFDAINKEFDPATIGLSSVDELTNKIETLDTYSKSVDKILNNPKFATMLFNDKGPTETGQKLIDVKAGIDDTLDKLRATYHDPIIRSFNDKYKDITIDGETIDNSTIENMIEDKKILLNLFKEQAQILSEAVEDYIKLEKYYNSRGDRSEKISKARNFIRDINDRNHGGKFKSATSAEMAKKFLENKFGIISSTSVPMKEVEIKDKDLLKKLTTAKTDDDKTNIEIDYLKKKGIMDSTGTIDNDKAIAFMRGVNDIKNLPGAYRTMAFDVFDSVIGDYVATLLHDGMDGDEFNTLYNMSLTEKIGIDKIDYLTDIAIRDIFGKNVKKHELGAEGPSKRYLNKEVRDLTRQAISDRLDELKIVTKSSKKNKKFSRKSL